METRRAAHPTPDVLKAFGLGKLDDSSSGFVVDHLDQCDDCRQHVAALSSDDFLDRLRQAQAHSSTPAPAQPLAEVAHAAKPSATPTPIPNLPPELAANQQYEILRELGRGGMGVVYLAKNKLMDRLEVLKVVNKALLDRPGAVERFLREIRSAAKLNHVNVVAAYSAVQQGSLLAFAMEYVEGEDLASVVKSQGPLPMVHACFYMQQAALGLQHALEKHMVHRDIKPQNLILAREGKKHIVKVLDFGLAKATSEKQDDLSLTGEGRMLGTPDYIAPEQCLDAARADIRADIYSLGCTLYHLLAGRPPFSASSLSEILLAHQMQEAKPLNLVRPEMPAELATVVRKMMAKSPAQRYQTPLEVVQALAPFVKQRASSKSSPELSVGTATAAGGKAMKSEPPPLSIAPAIPPPPMPQAPPALPWEALTEGKVTSAQPRRSETIRQPSAPLPKPSAKQLRRLVVGIAVSVLLLALLGMWARGVFKVKTKDGTIVLENLPADAEVLVDGKTVTLKVGDGKTITITAGEKHQLQVKKEGFKVFGQVVEIDAGEQRPIRVHLQRELAEDKPPPPPASEPVADNKGDGPNLNRQARIASGIWRVENGELVHKDAVSANCRILFGGREWTDYDYSFEVVKTGGAFGVAAIFRASDVNNFLLFDLAGWQNRKYTVESCVNGKTGFVALNRPGAMVKNRTYRVLVKVRGDDFHCYLNGALIYGCRDRRHARGAVGFRCWGGAVRINSIKVTSPDGKCLWEGVPELKATIK